MWWKYGHGTLGTVRAVRPLLLIIAAVVAAFLCGLPGQAEAQLKTVTVLTGADPYYSPIFVAAKNGYYKDEGLNVEIRMFPSGTDAMFAFRSIDAQFLAAGDAPSLILWQGNDVVGIAPIYASPDNLFGIVRADIKSAADLKGKKIATRKGSTADYFLTEYLKRNGIKSTDVNIINLGPEQCAPALSSGSIDGFFIWRPYPSLALRLMGDKARVLTTARGYYLEQIYLTANRKFAAENPKEIEDFLKATNRGVEFIESHPKESASIIAQQIKGTVDLVDPVIKTKPYTMQYGPPNKEQLTKLVSFLEENAKLKAPVSLDHALDLDFLRAVDPKLVTASHTASH